MEAIAEAARSAPTAPGVYFMLAADRELLYIGKAGNIRRRLQQHAKGAALATTLRDLERRDRVVDVRWECTATEADAADREADLVIAFAPAVNGSLATDGRWTYIDVRQAPAQSGRAAPSATFTTTADPAPPGAHGRRYGCFPHLGPGGSSRRSDSCTGGYVSLLRLLWAAGEPDERARHPPSIAGASVGARPVTLPLPPTVAPSALGRFFGGVSPKCVHDLRAGALALRPPVMHPGVERDAEAALRFFEHGPQVVRGLRRRHELPATKPLTREAWIDALRAEVEQIVGEFSVPAAAPALEHLVGGRRARAIAQRTRRTP